MATDTLRTPHRPDGITMADYEGYKEWTFRRWAWEFLRRNPEFIAACKRVRNDPARQVEVARDFGLKRFKAWTEPFSGQSGRPQFVSASVSSWSNLDEPDARRPNPAVRSGQVLIRFDLSATLNDVLAISAQVRSAERVVRRHQETYIAMLGGAEPPAPASKPMYFLRSLRLLDLLDGKSAQHREVGRALRIVNEAQGTKSPMSDAEAREKHRKQVEQARELASQGYRHLANRPARPSPKVFR